jgi:hypothetical protein
MSLSMSEKCVLTSLWCVHPLPRRLCQIGRPLQSEPIFKNTCLSNKWQERMSRSPKSPMRPSLRLFIQGSPKFSAVWSARFSPEAAKEAIEAKDIATRTGELSGGSSLRGIQCLATSQNRVERSYRCLCQQILPIVGLCFVRVQSAKNRC